MPKKKYYQKKVSTQRHYFLFKVMIGDREVVHRIPTRMRYGTKTVKIKLTEDDAKRAIDFQGYGNTQTCVMALCVKGQARAFPHDVDGYVDWTYNRAYVVSKVDKKSGLPAECIVYEHHDNVAKNFDKLGEDGLIELWKDLRDNGPKEITLEPIKSRSGVKQKKRSTVDRDIGRERGGQHVQPRGAALRYGIATLGLTNK